MVGLDFTSTESQDVTSLSVSIPLITTVSIPYELLLDRPLYKKVITIGADEEFVDGVYYPSSTPTISYVTFTGEWEPLGRGESTYVLPKGVNSTDAIIVFSDTELNVALNNNGTVSDGDVIYLKDPNFYPSAFEYLVFDKEVWDTFDDFQLLDTDSYDYICIRKELQ